MFNRSEINFIQYLGIKTIIPILQKCAILMRDLFPEFIEKC